MKKFTAIKIIILVILLISALAFALAFFNNEFITEPKQHNLKENDYNNHSSFPKKGVSPEVEISSGEWTLNSYGEITAPNGFSYNLERYDYYIIADDLNRCLLMSGSMRSIVLVNSITKDVVFLSGDQKIIDYTVAYDTLYWFNLNRDVWCVNWQSDDLTTELFCEDAIAVSPFTDECQGAIVSPEKANIDYGYGDLPIYSPYGIVD